MFCFSTFHLLSAWYCSDIMIAKRNFGVLTPEVMTISLSLTVSCQSLKCFSKCSNQNDRVEQKKNITSRRWELKAEAGKLTEAGENAGDQVASTLLVKTVAEVYPDQSQRELITRYALYNFFVITRLFGSQRLFRSFSQDVCLAVAGFLCLTVFFPFLRLIC